MSVSKNTLSSLYAIATGQVQHVYNGLCPDGLEGPHVRDDECPACLLLIAADNECKESGFDVAELATSH